MDDLGVPLFHVYPHAIRTKAARWYPLVATWSRYPSLCQKNKSITPVHLVSFHQVCQKTWKSTMNSCPCFKATLGISIYAINAATHAPKARVFRGTSHEKNGCRWRSPSPGPLRSLRLGSTARGRQLQCAERHQDAAGGTGPLGWTGLGIDVPWGFVCFHHFQGSGVGDVPTLGDFLFPSISSFQGSVGDEKSPNFLVVWCLIWDIYQALMKIWIFWKNEDIPPKHPEITTINLK